MFEGPESSSARFHLYAIFSPAKCRRRRPLKWRSFDRSFVELSDQNRNSLRTSVFAEVLTLPNCCFIAPASRLRSNRYPLSQVGLGKKSVQLHTTCASHDPRNFPVSFFHFFFFLSLALFFFLFIKTILNELLSLLSQRNDR